MLNSTTPVAGSTPPAGTAVPGSAWAWAGFEGFRNPAVVLITIYVFMPYHVASVAGRPLEGQALIPRAGQVAGKAVAFTAPLPGVTVDRLGSRKPARTMYGARHGAALLGDVVRTATRPDRSGRVRGTCRGQILVRAHAPCRWHACNPAVQRHARGGHNGLGNAGDARLIGTCSKKQLSPHLPDPGARTPRTDRTYSGYRWNDGRVRIEDTASTPTKSLKKPVQCAVRTEPVSLLFPVNS